MIDRATASDPVSGEVGGDDSGAHDPVERAGASDADNAGGNLYDTAKMKMIRDESGKRIGAGKAFALDAKPS